jgi:uncharacterized surface protein with fasciclin (FAS1) repeats
MRGYRRCRENGQAADSFQARAEGLVHVAQVNSALIALPAVTVDTLLKPENKATLTKILTCYGT